MQTLISYFNILIFSSGTLEKSRISQKEGVQRGCTGEGLSTENKEISTNRVGPLGLKSCSHFELVSKEDLRFKIRKIGKGKKSESLFDYVIISDSFQRIFTIRQFYNIFETRFYIFKITDSKMYLIKPKN